MAKDETDFSATLKQIGRKSLRKSWSSVKEKLFKASPEKISLLDTIFEANMKDLRRFPKITGTFGHPPLQRANAEKYLEKWANKFLNAKLPSEHKGSKSELPYDALVYKIISALQPNESDDVDEVRKLHEMTMQSEIIVGDLLEEYINSVISPFGWIWCQGACMQATDFYHPGKPELFLQIKNKFNSENSSSKQIRKGRRILKWNRLINKKVDGSDVAESNWNELHKIVFEKVKIKPGDDVVLSEQGFKDFVEDVCKKNPDLIFY